MTTAPLSENQNTENITVRLDPKIRYGLELLARKRHQSISKVTRWVIEYAISLPTYENLQAENERLKAELLTLKTQFNAS